MKMYPLTQYYDVITYLRWRTATVLIAVFQRKIIRF